MQPSDRQGLQERSRDVSSFACPSTAVSAAIRPVPLTLSDARFCMGMPESSLPSASDLLQVKAPHSLAGQVSLLYSAFCTCRPVARGVHSFSMPASVYAEGILILS